LAKLAAARTKLEARADERYEREMAEGRAKLAAASYSRVPRETAEGKLRRQILAAASAHSAPELAVPALQRSPSEL
jgi:hypothetical protein